MGDRARGQEIADHGRHAWLALGGRDADVVRPDIGDRRAVDHALGARHLELGAAHLDPAAPKEAVEPVDVAEELVNERTRRMVVDLLRRAGLLDPPFVHHDDPVGQLERLLLVVGHEHAGQPHAVVQLAKPATQLLAHLGVERAERLVEQEDPGLDGERPGERHPLALAAGQLARIALRQPFQLHEVQQVHDLVPDLRLRCALPARLDPQAEGHVLEDGHVPEQGVVLEYEADLPLADMAGAGVLAVEQDGALGRELEPGDDPEQRGLARPGRAEQGDQLARADPEVDAGERREAIETLGDLADIDGHGLKPPAHRRAATSSAP
jgi:hypothetical protein